MAGENEGEDFGVGLDVMEDGSGDETLVGDKDGLVSDVETETDDGVVDSGEDITEMPEGGGDETPAVLTKGDVASIVNDAIAKATAPRQQPAPQPSEYSDDDEPVTQAQLRQQQQYSQAQAYAAQVRGEFAVERSRLPEGLLNDKEALAVEKLAVSSLQAGTTQSASIAYKEAVELFSGRDTRAIRRFVKTNRAKAVKTKGEAAGSGSPAPTSNLSVSNEDLDDDTATLRLAEKIMRQETRKAKRP